MGRPSKHLEVRRFVTFMDTHWRQSVHVCYLDWMYVEGCGWEDGKVEDALLKIAEEEGVTRNLIFAREVSY